MANFYCEYCGYKASSIQNLVAHNCPKHPNGVHKGKHKLYEGSEKSEYFCKYCGYKASSIQNLVTHNCPKHPDGVHKGKHAPTL